jgi:hypothetical protein
VERRGRLRQSGGAPNTARAAGMAAGRRRRLDRNR